VRGLIAVAVVTSACGRINFVPLDLSDCSFAIQAAPSQVNLNSRVQLTAQGARGAVTWQVASGLGSIDASGEFFAGDRVEVVTIEATDDSGCSASTTVNVRGSTLFYVAGSDANDIPQADVWSSTDGVTWQSIGALPAARQLGKLLVFEDRMWWLGGSSIEIWSSSDGVTWRAESPMRVGLSELGSAVYRGRMWTVGGNAGGNIDTVYSSADGVTWEVTGHAPTAMHGTKCLQYLDRLWCLGGHDASGRFARVFSSIDGVTWVDEAPMPTIREEQGQIATADGALIMVAGSDAAGATRDGAVTRDGVTWAAQGMLPGSRFVTDLAQLGDTIYVAGAESDVLASFDAGATWNIVGQLPAYRQAGGFVAFTPH
jgi:hypothetical protein